MSHFEAFQDGLLAAKAGKKMVARLQFEQVTELKPDFIHGWLWLAWTADSPEQAEQFLATAEKLDPDNRLVTTYKEVVTALALYETDEDFSAFLAPSESQAEDVEESTQAEVAHDESDSEDEDSDEAQGELETQIEESADPDEVVADEAEVDELEAEVDELEADFDEADELEEDLAAEVSEETTDIEAGSDEDADSVEGAADSDQSAESLSGQEETKDFEEIRSEIAAAKLSDEARCEKSSEVVEAFDETTLEDDSAPEEDPTRTTSNAGSNTVSAEETAAAMEEAAREDADEESRIAADVSELNEDIRATVGIDSSEPEPSAENELSTTDEEESLAEEASIEEEPLREEAEEAAEEATKTHTILVVDDSPTVRKLVTMTLKSGGFAVETAEDGVEAMKMLVNFTPDLILLDVNMPRMDGYKLCKLIKRHEKTKFIPVVMLSGKDGMFDKLRGTLVGCNDYISKPFESADLLRHVEEYVYASTEKSGR